MRYIFNVFVLSIVFVLFHSCSNINGVSIDEVSLIKTTQKNSYHLEDTPYTGRVYEYFPDTEILKQEFNVLDGFLSGLCNEYYVDGVLKSSISYEKGILNGLSQKYYQNGQLKESVNYSQGNFNGKRMVYWSNGVLKELNTFKNGILGGENLYYYSDGKLRKSLRFDQNGKRNGIWEDFHPNGQLKNQIIYSNGSIVSKSDTYDFLGNIIR
ncbi:MAG: toxin-antitoxin system YwqK family antitoxin [Flavobacteriaceae bacterium]|nr:toxin-antitoxin system YwqK family antitoxin [Flavobacteriaceae bacterium]